MRQFVTIAVAAVLVATCGPAPCPCHLATLLWPASKQDTRLPLPPRPSCPCCLAHHSDASTETISGCATQTDRLPDPLKQPCEHSPKVELGATGVLGELHVKIEADRVEAAPSDPFRGSRIDHLATTVQSQICLLSLPHLRALRFAHAFRV